jgi:hypothetical protein
MLKFDTRGIKVDNIINNNNNNNNNINKSVSHYTPASYIALSSSLGLAVPWYRLKVAGLSQRWFGFDSGPLHVRFVVSKETVEEYFGLPLYLSSNNVPSSIDIRKTCGRILGTCKLSGAHFDIEELRI